MNRKDLKELGEIERGEREPLPAAESMSPDDVRRCQDVLKPQGIRGIDDEKINKLVDDSSELVDESMTLVNEATNFIGLTIEHGLVVTLSLWWLKFSFTIQIAK